MTKNAFFEVMESLECYDCGKALTPDDVCTDGMQIICEDCLAERYMCPCGCQDNDKTCVYTPTNKDNKETKI